MSVLFETNVLLRLAQKQPPHRLIADRALELLLDRNEDVVIATQSLVEFWAGATRPIAANGLGLKIEETVVELENMKYLFASCPKFRSMTNGCAL